MANHGYCSKCWWWKIQSSTIVPFNIPDIGVCYMHSFGSELCVTNQDSYCPDYYNRKKGNREQKQTIEEWIKEKGL